MGCNSSKAVEEATTYVYRPAPTSFAVFDINSIEEPWIVVDKKHPAEPELLQLDKEKQLSHVPAPAPAAILEKLSKLDHEADTPNSWDEVSKVLQDLNLKPTLGNYINKNQNHHPLQTQPQQENQQTIIKKSNSNSIHTLEELDAKLSSKPRAADELITAHQPQPQPQPQPNRKKIEAPIPTTSYNRVRAAVKPVKDNIFILKDRIERQQQNSKQQAVVKWDPLSEYPEKCPPGGSDSVVVYTTSLRGVRRTFEDCTRVRALLEGHHVVVDERDVSLHWEFLNELKELLQGGVGMEGEYSSSHDTVPVPVTVPKVFVKGRYIGGVDEVVDLNESGRLGRMLVYARVDRVVGRQACQGCGDARFLPCLECGGSCKVLVEQHHGIGVNQRCLKCNENGLVRCPNCL